MLDLIKQFLLAAPFQPFTVVSSGGMKYFVATRDHASIDPSGKHLAIWYDNGSGVMISVLHITAVERNEAAVALD